MSPVPGRSTLITSAPNHARSCVQVGPDWTCVKSRIRTPSRALPSWPQGWVEGLDAADLAVALALLGADFFVAIFDPPNLFLAKHALRVEVADAAALAAGRRVDHRVDESGLARIHRLVDGS